MAERAPCGVALTYSNRPILLVLFVLVFAIIVIPYGYQWYRYLSYRP